MLASREAAVDDAIMHAIIALVYHLFAIRKSLGF